MWSLGQFVVSGLILCANAALVPLEIRQGRGYGPYTINQQTERDLAAMICRNSTIIDPSDAAFLNATERFLQNITPDIKLIVRPGCEGDVQKIVKYAYDRKIPIYANNRGHAVTSSVSKFSGLEIDIRYLNSTYIQPNKQTARFGGGARSYEVITGLYKQGYQTATGGCGCVSLIGPALGGGHGLQQGHHGLTMDNFVSLNMVLADGSAITVNPNSNADLWWAMRGAGHNFGIVTSFESKIWPVAAKQYLIRTYYFDGKVHDQLINEVNKFSGNGTQNPDWLATYGVYGMNSTLDANKATINWIFFYGGQDIPGARKQLAPFDALNTRPYDEQLVTYDHANDPLGGNPYESPLCIGNLTHIVGTSYLQTYNVTAQRQIYDLYNDKVKQQPRLNTSTILMENYAQKAVKAQNYDDSAYAGRTENILTNFQLKLETNDDPLVSFGQQWRDEVVDLWYRGQINRQGKVYVNYAAGFETIPARYGYEPWRLDRLRKLKAKYDPQNKFAWYNPIIPPQ